MHRSGRLRQRRGHRPTGQRANVAQQLRRGLRQRDLDEPLDVVTIEAELVGSLRRESFYPIVQGYKDTAAVGVRYNISDRIRLNRASVTASFSPVTDLPVSERFHVQGDYERYDWRGRASFNKADFYDLFGPTKTGRRGYEVGVGRTTTARLPGR